MLKKSGILLAVLALTTFTLAFSASAQIPQDGPGKPLCRCTTSAQCHGGGCCWWSGQKCGICCN